MFGMRFTLSDGSEVFFGHNGAPTTRKEELFEFNSSAPLIGFQTFKDTSNHSYKLNVIQGTMIDESTKECLMTKIDSIKSEVQSERESMQGVMDSQKEAMQAEITTLKQTLQEKDDSQKEDMDDLRSEQSSMNAVIFVFLALLTILGVVVVVIGVRQHFGPNVNAPELSGNVAVRQDNDVQ